MAQLWAALKSLSLLADFVRWAAEFVRSLVAESKKQHADATHAENEAAIDAAFPVGSDGLHDPSAAGPGKADAGAPADTASPEVRPGVGS